MKSLFNVGVAIEWAGLAVLIGTDLHSIGHTIGWALIIGGAVLAVSSLLGRRS